jgi:hypothetical protein
MTSHSRPDENEAERGWQEPDELASGHQPGADEDERCAEERQRMGEREIVHGAAEYPTHDDQAGGPRPASNSRSAYRRRTLPRR